MTNHNHFASLFGAAPAVQGAAPGRVNLIGEHTDYNGGFVLPTPIPQRTIVALRPTGGNMVRASSANIGAALAEYDLGTERPGRGWLDYLQGITRLLRMEGHRFGGFDVLVESTVPLGSGLSSSAALELAFLKALRTAFELRLGDLALARLGQRVENEFVGAHVGIMDQMACGLGQAGSALFIDTRSLGFERIPLPADGELVVINSGVAHQHAAGDYNTRRAECERAAALLGVGQLRDVGPADLPRIAGLPEPLSRRARHIVTENQRVLDAVACLRAGDLAGLGELFLASHASQRDDYAVSIPPIDLLVELAQRDPAVYGARLTGGGFGGSVVLLVRAGAGGAVARGVVAAYQEQTSHHATVLVPADSTAL